MTPVAVAWSMALAALGLCVLGWRAWRTLGEGRGFQADLSTLTTDQLHAYLSAPRGSDPARPADILYRLNALMEFERRGDPRLVPLFVQLLADPHLSIVKICHEALRERTGVDFRDAENDTLPDPAAWKAWWESEGRKAG